jgi:hypothetical protein
VAEKLLDCPKVHASLQKMGGESVTECVRMEVVEIRGVADCAVELPSDGTVAEPSPALIDEQWLAPVRDASAPAGAFG